VTDDRLPFWRRAAGDVPLEQDALELIGRIRRFTSESLRKSSDGRCKRCCKNFNPRSRIYETTQTLLWRGFCFRRGMTAAIDDLDSLSERVIGCAIAVHRALGPGLLESIYRQCLIIELKAEKIRAEQEQRVALTYRGEPIAGHLTLDLLVEGRLVVELKSVEQIKPVHLAQVITYLKLTGHPAGLLLNFNSTSLRAGLRRLHHPDLYLKKRPS
jgi:GxxExxY protein